MSTRVFRLIKRGTRVSAVLEGGGDGEFVFTQVPGYEPLGADRVFAVDTESLTRRGRLATLITTIRWHDGDQLIETPEGTGMLARLCAAVSDRYGIPEERASRTKQRVKKYRPGSRRSRDGRRKTIPPVLSVWFNLPYDFGRLAADRPEVLRSVVAGSDSYRVKVSARFEIEIVRLHFGSSASFEWFIRDAEKKTVVRLLGLDLCGYWKTSLKKAAAATGVTPKVDIESRLGPEWFKTPRERFTDAEWKELCAYAVGDVATTLELYHATVLLLRDIDARAVRRTGVIPPSAPGAAARVVFARAFDLHPSLRKENGGPGCWPRPRPFADQLGCDSYYGGRVFCTRPGLHTGLITLDIKSAYPYALACLPDPVTAVYEYVRERKPDTGFSVDEWRGKWGVLRIDGYGLDDLHPALRTHDTKNKRLRYLTGPFKNHAATIPEIVIGVLSGALRVDRIREGVLMRGTAETSFLRDGMRAFFAIKNDTSKAKALRDMAKLLANATYGKLVEVNARDYSIADNFPMNRFLNTAGVSKTLARIYAGTGPDPEPDDYFGETEPQIARARALYSRALSTIEPGERRAGLAVAAYLEALLAAGVPHDGSGQLTTVGDFMRTNTRFRCGQYFMPLCASLLTGLTSATVGLMARCLDAWQGDTDSVHVKLPPGVTRHTDLPGWARYHELLAAAGYGERIPGAPDLGKWECESSAPTVESVLARPKLYSHKFPDGTYKQAKHGFSRFPTDDAELHRAIGALARGESYSYDTRATPRKLREAVLSGAPVGEFTSRKMTMGLKPDPNTWKDENGIIRWLTLEGKPMQKRSTDRAITGDCHGAPRPMREGIIDASL
jgi:hypothetical protein